MFSAIPQTLIALLMISSTHAAGPAVINLATAGSFTILAKAGVSTVPSSLITGNVGVSPIAATALTGFSLTKASAGTFATSAQVVGQLLAADFTSPTPSTLTTAVLDMQAAFTDGFGRASPTSLNLLGGILTSQTLAPGLYKWTSAVTVTTSLTLKGSATDVWIFQIQNGLNYASGAKTVLSGGALSKNIFWVVSESVTLGTTSLLDGVILAATNVALLTGASVNGRILAQTAVTLQMSTVKPV
ncbi:hypothetical protein HYPSUDRAFT_198632 [Hypholoma sublateritium FD-334 SS-4]|uniref:Antifreeze protein n=1 Tax=Hypholoma sublateritium (strain FD-334 SS-4) TaxID=945553 RepID=A0A0D2MS66_HYPSF|nr:hypothetical protein HYPSUDRAFT_198632 [Hypholoma sublateritium FD-334 SS-4]